MISFDVHGIFDLPVRTVFTDLLIRIDALESILKNLVPPHFLLE